MPETKEAAHAEIIQNCYALRSELKPLIRNMETHWKQLAHALRDLRGCIRSAQDLLCPHQLWEDRQGWIRAREHDAALLAQSIEQLARMTQQLQSRFPPHCPEPCCEHCPEYQQRTGKEAGGSATGRKRSARLT